MAEREIDAVVFDFGGVLTLPVRVSTAGWLADDGIEVDSYRAAMRDWLGRRAEDGSPVHRLETGELSGEQFERELAARLVTVDGRPVVAEGLLGRLFAGMRSDEVMMALVAEIRALGMRVGLLSNSWANHYPPGLADAFDQVVISGEVGLRKPDPRIYRLMSDKMGVPAERSAFVDDSVVNVAAAEALGWHAVRHVDAASTRAALARWVPDLPPTLSVAS